MRTESHRELIVACDRSSETGHRRCDTLVAGDNGLDHPIFGWKDLAEN